MLGKLVSANREGRETDERLSVSFGFHKRPEQALVRACAGVLLLNACLTVRAHAANSHKDRGWEKLTDMVVGCLNKRRSNLAFLLWGAYAQKKGAIIDRVGCTFGPWAPTERGAQVRLLLVQGV